MPRILLFIAPTVGRWLWRRYRAKDAQRQVLPRAATRPNTSEPQEQIQAMEQDLDAPGGIRP